MKIAEWFKRKEKKTQWQLRREYLLQQLEMSEEFYKFMHAAYSRGYEAELTVKVDGQVCKVGVDLARVPNSKELFEYLCNWSVAQRFRTIEELTRHDNPGLFSPGGILV
jgi:hypothetical protein